MNPIYFSATLKTAGGQFLEYGQAFLSQNKEGTVNFTGDFVPLIRIGETVQVVRTLGERELDRFTGQVYLSSRRLLQVVGINSTSLREAHRIFDCNANLAADIYLVKAPHFSIQKGDKLSGFVRYISPDTLKICTMEFVDEGAHLALSAEGMSLLLDDMLVQVTERVMIMRNSAILICNVLASSPENEEILTGYFARRQNMLDKD
ncbi:MAG: hypothetical protein RSD78_03205 [Oscillospiraceae bacterium]